MKKEEEIRLKRLEIIQIISKLIKVSKKMKRKYGLESSTISPNQVYAVGFMFSFDLLNWILDESSGRLLNKAISIFENLDKALLGAEPPEIDLEFSKIVEEIHRLSEQVTKDARNLLTIDWNELK